MKALFAVGTLTVAIFFAMVSAAPNHDNDYRKYMYTSNNHLEVWKPSNSLLLVKTDQTIVLRYMSIIIV